MSTSVDDAGDWSRAPERSNALALRLMSFIALACGRSVARAVLHPIALYFLLFAPAARRHSARYLERAFGRRPRWLEQYRHFHAFAAVTLDRIYLLKGRTDLFDITLQGQDIVDRLIEDGRGAFLIGAHFGSFEVLRSLGESHGRLPVAMVMYLDNARKINDALKAIAPDSPPKVIALGRMESMLAVRDWLDAGGVAGILGDRALPGESPHADGQAIEFLGSAALFGDGPFRMAALLRRRVIFMTGVYLGGNRYDVRFEELADFGATQPGASDRDQLVRQALDAYVARLETTCHAHPMNWFNFHDFWREDTVRRHA